MRLTEQICNVSQFLCRFRVQLRHGELTRAPLKLLRLEVLEESMECDWLARPQDLWDADLPGKEWDCVMHRCKLFAMQLTCALSFLEAFPALDSAHFRIYRDSPDEKREMIVTGHVQRNDNSSRRLHSLSMRARVLGFRFHLEDDILSELPKGGNPFPATSF